MVLSRQASISATLWWRFSTCFRSRTSSSFFSFRLLIFSAIPLFITCFFAIKSTVQDFCCRTSHMYFSLINILETCKLIFTISMKLYGLALIKKKLLEAYCNRLFIFTANYDIRIVDLNSVDFIPYYAFIIITILTYRLINHFLYPLFI